MLLVRDARADTFFSFDPDTKTFAKKHRIYINYEAGNETLIEEIEVINTSNEFAWLLAFPTRPETTEADPKTFETLDAQTTIKEPYNETIRDNLFGPSVVTLLSHRLRDKSSEPEQETEDKTRRSLSLFETYYFTGQVTSSTITFKRVLPEGLKSWLARQGIDPAEGIKQSLAYYLNQGWTVMATGVSDPAPSATEPAVLGPFKYDFPHSGPTYPIISGDRFSDRPPYEMYIRSSLVFIPRAFRIVWDDKPWEKKKRKDGEFYAIFSQKIEPVDIAADALREITGAGSLESFHLTRLSFRHAIQPKEEIALKPAEDPVLMPNDRGSVSDIILLLILGLTPLFYTPESWFLLWLGSRARARARKEGKAFGVRIWSVYAIVVGAFWFVTLPEMARIAAIVPILIGLAQLSWPYTERDTPPVRSIYRKKKT